MCPPTDKYALTEDDKKVIFKEYEKLADMMIERRKQGKPFTFYHYMLNLEGGPCIYKRISGCGSGTEYLAVTPTGELYPCHQFVGNKEYLMGDIWKGVTNLDIQSKFKKCNAYSRKECDDCWARLYCSGGCAANAYNATGDVNGVYAYGCDLFKNASSAPLCSKWTSKRARNNKNMAKKNLKTNAMRILDQKKVAYKEHTLGITDAVSGVEAASLLGVDESLVFKTLVTVGKSLEHYVFVIPVACELDLKKAAACVNEKSVEMVKSKDLLALTGYVHGGCSPIGMKKFFKTTIDQSALDVDRIFFSGGRIGFQIETTLDELKKAIVFQLKDVAVR